MSKEVNMRRTESSSSTLRWLSSFSALVVLLTPSVAGSQSGLSLGGVLEEGSGSIRKMGQNNNLPSPPSSSSSFPSSAYQQQAKQLQSQQQYNPQQQNYQILQQPNYQNQQPQTYRILQQPQKNYQQPQPQKNYQQPQTYRILQQPQTNYQQPTNYQPPTYQILQQQQLHQGFQEPHHPQQNFGVGGSSSNDDVRWRNSYGSYVSTKRPKKHVILRQVIRVVTTEEEEKEDCESKGGNVCFSNDNCCYGNCTDGFCPTAKEILDDNRREQAEEEALKAEDFERKEPRNDGMGLKRSIGVGEEEHTNGTQGEQWEVSGNNTGSEDDVKKVGEGETQELRGVEHLSNDTLELNPNGTNGGALRMEEDSTNETLETSSQQSSTTLRSKAPEMEQSSSMWNLEEVGSTTPETAQSSSTVNLAEGWTVGPVEPNLEQNQSTTNQSEGLEPTLEQTYGRDPTNEWMEPIIPGTDQIPETMELKEIRSRSVGELSGRSVEEEQDDEFFADDHPPPPFS